VVLGGLCAWRPAAAQVDGPLDCKLVKFTSSYVLDCQVVVDFATFDDIVFNGGGCPSLKELYRSEGRLNFGAVPPEIGKVFKSGDQFSLSVNHKYCPNLTELTAGVDGRGYTVKLR
jgi:hypothetical protein